MYRVVWPTCACDYPMLMEWAADFCRKCYNICSLSTRNTRQSRFWAPQKQHTISNTWHGIQKYTSRVYSFLWFLETRFLNINHCWLTILNNLVRLVWILSCYVYYRYVWLRNHWFLWCLLFMNFFCLFIDNIFEFVAPFLFYLHPLLILWNPLSNNYFLAVKDKALCILMSSIMPLLFLS